MKRKSAAAVELGRKGGIKGGPARAASLTPEQRSESARKAVTARWTKNKMAATTPTETNVARNVVKTPPTNRIDATDKALVNLLNRLKATVDPAEIRELSNQIERVIFHKQFTNAYDPEASSIRNSGSHASTLSRRSNLNRRFH
jgi:hypothetical protein